MNIIRVFLIAVFFQSFLVNASLTFLQGIIVSRFQGSHFSDIFFITTLISIGAFFTLSMVSLRRQAHFHLILLSSAVILIGLLSITPSNQTLSYLYAAGIVLLLQDIIAPSILSAILSNIVTPAKFSSVYQHVLSAQLTARACAAFAIYTLGKLAVLENLAWILAPLLIGHLAGLAFISKNIRPVAIPAHEVKDTPPTLAAFKFLWKNSLVRAATLLAAGACIGKFLVDLALLQAMQSLTTDLNESTKIFSKISFINILCIYLFQTLIAKRYLLSKPMSQLLALTPAAVVTTSLAALFYGNIYLVALIFLTQQALNRSIQGPIVRQLFLLAPLQVRQRVYQISQVHISVLTALMASLLAYFPNSLNMTLILLILSGLAMFFVITDVDTYFLKNFWKHYRQSVSGQWLGPTPLEALSFFSLVDKSPQTESGKPFTATELKSSVLNAYEKAYSPAALGAATQRHWDLFVGDQTSNSTLGSEVAFVSGLPLFKNFIEKSHLSPAETAFQKLKTDHLPSPTRRKIRFILLDALRDSRLLSVEEKLSWLLHNTPAETSMAFLDVLYHLRSYDLRKHIYPCLNGDGTISLEPLFKEYEKLRFDEARTLRMVLERLGPQFGIQTGPHLLERTFMELNEYPGIKTGDPETINLMQKALFLEEWLGDPKSRLQYLRETLSELGSGDHQSRKLLLELHLEALRGTPRYRAWKKTMEKR